MALVDMGKLFWDCSHIRRSHTRTQIYIKKNMSNLRKELRKDLYILPFPLEPCGDLSAGPYRIPPVPVSIPGVETHYMGDRLLRITAGQDLYRL